MNCTIGAWSVAMLTLLFSGQVEGADSGTEIPAKQLGSDFRSFTGKAQPSSSFTWWLPAQPDTLVMPIAAGTFVETSNAASMRWLKDGWPWDLLKLPLIGARYGDRTLVVIVPWPHY